MARDQRSDDDVERWLAELAERADPFMSWLGVLFALVVVYEFAVDLSPAASRALNIVSWVIWALFLTEFAVRLYLAPHRGRFLARNWVQILTLAVPTLRLLRFARLLRAGRALPAARVLATSYRSAGRARRLLRSRLGYLVALSVLVILAVAELAYLAEGQRAGPTFGSFADALLWSAIVVVALQGDPLPASFGGRLVMLAGFAFGLVVFASLAGTIGAFFVDDRREREHGS